MSLLLTSMTTFFVPKFKRTSVIYRSVYDIELSGRHYWKETLLVWQCKTSSLRFYFKRWWKGNGAYNSVTLVRYVSPSINLSAPKIYQQGKKRETLKAQYALSATWALSIKTKDGCDTLKSNWQDYVLHFTLHWIHLWLYLGLNIVGHIQDNVRPQLRKYLTTAQSFVVILIIYIYLHTYIITHKCEMDSLNGESIYDEEEGKIPVL